MVQAAERRKVNRFLNLEERVGTEVALRVRLNQDI